MAQFGSLIVEYKYHALLILLTFIFARLWKNHAQRKVEEQFAAERGCKTLRPWTAKWPLGLDFLVRVSYHARKDQILNFFVTALEDCPYTYRQSLLGSEAIGTIEPENIEAVMSKQFTDFGLGLRPPTFYPLLGSGIFTQDGSEWKHSRELLRPQFLQNRSENFEQIKTCVENLIDRIPADGVVDFQPLFFRLTFDTTTFLLFGKVLSNSGASDGGGQESEFADAFKVGQEYLSYRGRLGDLYWLLNTKAFRAACKTCHRFVDEAVQSALDGSNERDEDGQVKSNYIFLNAIAQETRDPRVLRDQCLNLLLAGRDTTACCLSWTFRLLVRHPNVLDKLRQEIDSLVGIGAAAPQPTRNDLKKMHYLNLVIKEVLRLYPSVPVNGRWATKMTTLPVGGGEDGKSPFIVRKGEGVGYCVYAMHRRKDLYGDDAEEFRPERWEGTELKDIGYGYLPFNGGPRICMGQDFAMLEAGYTVARFIQKFPQLELPPGEPKGVVGKERQLLTLVVSSADGCLVKLAKDE